MKGWRDLRGDMAGVRDGRGRAGGLEMGIFLISSHNYLFIH